MGTQNTENKSPFVPKSYNKQAIIDLISGRTEDITIELEHAGTSKPIDVAASLTIASLNGFIKSDIVIPLDSYQLYTDELMLIFNINDQRIPLDQQKELRRITSPMELVGASTLNFTIRLDSADRIARSYSFLGEWREAS